ncbi:MAG: hypothetical protein LBM75_08145 [Myxococcales bacterium]|jgi:hypothetical protein|nr:hypothetical protein [Myxococcales bacterium]
MKFFLYLFIIIVIPGCQKTSPVSPHCEHIKFVLRPADQKLPLVPESYCEPISINAIRGGPPVECCVGKESLHECFPCPFGTDKWRSASLQLAPQIDGVAICGLDMLAFTWSMDFGWRVYLPEGKITPDVRQAAPWLRSVYKEERLLSVIYVARRCIERMPNKDLCLHWGEEEEFEQGFLCE